ncbi:uncharacterized protein LOC115754018 isoform X2 [Rhodamnia argentea]|uniref:Uncharacterized protein LOC115754018 isoform X2 n=1 Tax=Rhodamnia argentea TaxID=178133 RepID=A0ABM3H8R0_9MYRT|nr:uncharacterized protein LOC115754018 isoform X2 [Rhodamnia argentea]
MEKSLDASQPRRSFIPIESICIDLSSAIDRDYIGKCKCFSIREYVAEMRKKDEKICWPFTSGGNINAIKEQACKLPPLPLQNYQLRRCLNCLKRINVKAGRKETGTVLKCCSKRCLFDGPCSQMWSICEPSKTALDFQETLKLEVTEKREAIPDTSAFLTKGDCCTSLVADKSGKTDDESGAFREGNEEDGFEENRSLESVEFTRLRAVAPEVDQCQGQEIVKNDQVCNHTTCKGSPDSCQQGGSQEAQNTSENLQQGKQASGDGQEGIVTEDPEETLRMVSVAVQMPHYLTDCESGNPSLGMDGCDDSSSESADIGVGDSSHNHNRDKSHSLCRRRTRKTRLITELLKESKSTTTDHVGTDYPPRNALSEPSDKTNTVVQRQAVFAELVKCRFRGQKRKKKLISDEGNTKKLMTTSRENNDSLNCSGGVEDANVLLHPESKHRANAKMAPRIAIKNQTKNNYGSLNFPEKKMKRNLVIEDLSPAPSIENVSKCVQDKIEAGPACSARDLCLKLGRHTLSTTRLDSIPSSDQLVKTNYIPQATSRDTSSSMCKKNNEANYEKLSLIGSSSSSKRQDLMTRTDAGTTCLCPLAVHLRPAEDASAEDGLALSLTSRSAVPDVKRSHPPNPVFGQASSFSKKEATPKDGHIARKNLNSRYVESNVTSTCEVDVAKGILTDHNSKKATNRMPLLRDKQKNNLNLECSTCSQIPRMDISGMSNSGKNFCPQTQCTCTNQHFDSGTEKSSEQGILDDIPMEIVELMAKNQYERFLPDSENAEQPLEITTGSGGSESVNITKGVRKRDWSLLLNQGNHKQKPHPKKARNDRHTMGKDYIPAKQASVDGPSLPNATCSNVNQMEKNCLHTGLGGILQFAKKPSSEVALSLSSSGGHISNHYCKRDKHMVGVSLMSGGDESSVSVNRVCDSVPQHNEGVAHLSTATPNCMPFSYDTKMSALPTRSREFLHGSRTLPRLDVKGHCSPRYLRAKGIGFDKHRNNSSNINAGQTQHTRQSRMDLQNLSESTVLCSSETIPAMHLLSLMDGGEHTINWDGNPEPHQRPSFSHKYRSEEIAGLGFQSYKQPSKRMHPSSDYWAKGILSEHVSAVPTIDEPTHLSQPDRSFMGATKVAAQESLKMRKTGKKKCSEVATSNGADNYRSQKCIFPGGNLVTNHGLNPTLDGLRNFSDNPDDVAFPVHFDSESSGKDKSERQDRNGTLRPSQKDSEVQVCTVNKNPADFTVPEAGNRYMIGRSDLKFKKRYPFRNSPGEINFDCNHQRKQKVAGSSWS